MTTATWGPVPVSADPAADHGLAAHDADREFACLVSVRHVGTADLPRLRRVAGLTGMLADGANAELRLLVGASSPRVAQRHCVELIAAIAPTAVVTVPAVIDYDAALLEWLDRHTDTPGELPDTFDDAEAVADILDRG